MKFSLNWLREFVELPDDTQRLVDLLTLAGVEVENVQSRGVSFDKVVVAQIAASAPHPNADRLSVCRVNDGSAQERQIVCGAKNYRVGDKVPLALPGAVLPGELKIRASKLRGVESAGMLCSGRELGLSDDSAGLLILSPDAKTGAPMSDLFPTDIVLDVEITPNRADLLSHHGLAREIAALTGGSLHNRQIDPAPAVESDAVRISAPNECPFYSARRIEQVTVGPSPDWLRGKLEAAGLRSINNIVDLTNFVMLELGQPLHAFDADKLRGGINVRLASPNEKFLALDGRTYALDARTLLIADEQRALAIGGVMGGEDTGVSASTRNLLLESAFFSPASVRRTARALNLPSDASYRFERGVDPGMVLRASQRATELICEIAGGKPGNEILVAGALPTPPAAVSLRYRRAQQVLGIEIAADEMDQILGRFGLEKLGADSQQASWKIPSYRHDLRREVDLIEEIARVAGIDRVPAAERSRFTPASPADRRHDFETALRGRLVARGFSEARTSALIARDSLGGGFALQAVELRNPLSEDHVALRPSLVPGLLGALERNLRAGARSVRLFELGRVFLPPAGMEIRRVALLLCGNAALAPHWRNGPVRVLDFFDLKGALELLALGEVKLERIEHPDFALSATVRLDGRPAGLSGQLSSVQASKAAGATPVFVAEIDLPEELEISRALPKFAELQRFPSIIRDIALIMPAALRHGDVVAAINAAREPLLAAVDLFDLFSGQPGGNVAAGQKSLAFTLTYRDKNRTLTHEEVNAAHDRIRARLERELDVRLRK